MDRECILEDICRYFGAVDESAERKDKKTRLRLAKAAKKSFGKKQVLIAEISEVLDGYAVVDWEDEDACCYELTALLHKNQSILDNDIRLIEALGNTRYDLCIFISVIGPYFLSYVQRTEYCDGQWDFLILDRCPKEAENAVKRLERHFEEKEYEIISLDLARTIIPDIESRYKGLGDFTFFNGLFTDLNTIQNQKREAPPGLVSESYRQGLLGLYYLLWRCSDTHEGQEEPCLSEADAVLSDSIIGWVSDPKDPGYRKPWLDILEYYVIPEKASKEEWLLAVKAFTKKYENELDRRFPGAAEKIRALSPDDPVLYEAIQKACAGAV
jgi:hypothetical protein